MTGPTQADLDVWNDKQQALGRPTTTQVEFGLAIRQDARSMSTRRQEPTGHTPRERN